MIRTFSDEDLEKAKKAIQEIIHDTWDGFWNFRVGHTLIELELWDKETEI